MSRVKDQPKFIVDVEQSITSLTWLSQTNLDNIDDVRKIHLENEIEDEPPLPCKECSDEQYGE